MKPFHQHAPGARFLQGGGLPAGVMSYLVSDPDETVDSVTEDMFNATRLQVAAAFGSLHSRGFIRKRLGSPGHYDITKSGRVAIIRMRERNRLGL